MFVMQIKPKTKNEEQVKYQLDFRWPYSAEEVFLIGEWNGFQLTQDSRMVRDTTDPDPAFKLSISLSPGLYRFKFYVDNRWEVDPKKPVTLDCMSNLVHVKPPHGHFTTPTHSGNHIINIDRCFHYSIPVTHSVIEVLSACRSKIKMIDMDDMQTVNGKLLVALLQNHISFYEFVRHLTIAPELYSSGEACHFVMALFGSIMENGDSGILSEFLFEDMCKFYSACSECGEKEKAITFGQVFMIDIVDYDNDATLTSQILQKFIGSEHCSNCSIGTINTILSFKFSPRFLILKVNCFYKPDQLSETVIIINQKVKERHIYEVVGCCTTTAKTVYHSIFRINQRWHMTLDEEGDSRDLSSWANAVRQMTYGRCTMFIFERKDIRYYRSKSKYNHLTPSQLLHGIDCVEL